MCFYVFFYFFLSISFRLFCWLILFAADFCFDTFQSHRQWFVFLPLCECVCVCIMHILSSVSIFSFEKNIVFIWSLVFITIITKRLVGGIFFCFPLVSLFGSCGSSGGGCDVHVLKIAEKKKHFCVHYLQKTNEKQYWKRHHHCFSFDLNALNSHWEMPSLYFFSLFSFTKRLNLKRGKKKRVGGSTLSSHQPNAMIAR